MKKKIMAWLVEKFLPEYHLKRKPIRKAKVKFNGDVQLSLIDEVR